MTITIIGIGLIGGSLAKDLKKRGFAQQIFGVEKNLISAKRALELGLVDEIMEMEEAVKLSDIIVLSVPVSVAGKLSVQILDLVDNQIVFDVGSTKFPIVEAIKNHPKRANFVATHPMAGTEFTGPDAAISDLFDAKALILCDTNNSSERAIRQVKKIFDLLNMRIIEMDAQNHDVHAAYVSHISHISSFALALTVLHKEKDEKSIFNMASGGFESTVRLAKSSAEMWTPIFLQNKKNVLEVLDTYINFLYDFKLAIFNDDTERLNFLMNKGNTIREILDQKKKEAERMVNTESVSC